jgi:probable F420-dependent oxidoreductase
MTIARADLHGIGIASSTPYTDDVHEVADEARRVEDLGFVTLWRSGVLPMVEVAVRATERIPVATGIIPVSRVPAPDVVAAYEGLERDHPGRFVVGLGGAHDEHPLRTLDAYLDTLDEAGVPREARLLAALGPNMLDLARERTRGATRSS